MHRLVHYAALGRGTVQFATVILESDPMPNSKRMTAARFRQMKNQKKLAMVTAYDYQWAQLVDQAGVDAILVGDTLGMVVQGHQSTLPVTIDQMIYHGGMVARGANNALVVVDLPYLSYHVSVEDAIRNAGRVLKETEAGAVKLEGGVNQARTIEALVNAEIPVMGHVGLRPQAVRTMGSLGKIQRDQEQIIADAKAAESAGAFAIVLEMVVADIAQAVTEAVSIPTIGIGAGPGCDGQVLVLNDMLGLTPDFHPKFLKKYADLHSVVTQGIQEYIDEVEQGTFPDSAHSH